MHHGKKKYICAHAWVQKHWKGTPGFVLARLVLYYLSHAPSLFHSGYFGNRVSLFAQASLDHDLPFSYFPPIAGMTDLCHYSHLCGVKMEVIQTFLLRLA
jgi:hypothetical protein